VDVTVTATSTEAIWRNLIIEAANHFVRHHLVINGYNLMTIPIEYDDCPFVFLMGGNRGTRSEISGQKLVPVDMPSCGLTHAAFMTVANKVKHPVDDVPILFIGAL
jgi:hypothetical protein